MTFKKLELDQNLLATLEKLGLVTPTPIQEKAIPAILAGKDLQASAQTGTGKTAAFLLPALQMLSENRKKSKAPRVLILSPTRELASQISKEVKRFSSKLPHIKSVCIFGGTPYPQQNRELKSPHDILIATPGRLIDQLDRKNIDLSQIEIFILDEADRMLDMGFIDPVLHVAKQTSKNRQTLLFSATLKGEILKLSQQILKDPVHIEVKPTSVEKTQIKQSFHKVDDLNHKYALLSENLSQAEVNQTIIFTSTKRHAETLSLKLCKQGYKSVALHGDMRQRQRDRTIKLLKLKKQSILVATDVAARGIDLQDITHVINFDLPMSAEDYVHRIGRTGRAGATGCAISFATAKDRSILRAIERYTGQKIPIFLGKEPTRRKKRPSFRDKNHRRKSKKRFFK